MKLKYNTSPPKWGQRFLSWYCRPELAEDLESGVLAVIGLAFLLITAQTLKVARVNPANVLKTE